MCLRSSCFRRDGAAGDTTGESRLLPLGVVRCNAASTVSPRGTLPCLRRTAPPRPAASAWFSAKWTLHVRQNPLYIGRRSSLSSSPGRCAVTWPHSWVSASRSTARNNDRPPRAPRKDRGGPGWSTLRATNRDSPAHHGSTPAPHPRCADTAPRQSADRSADNRGESPRRLATYPVHRVHLTLLSNGVCERFLGSVRRGCLDHLLILREAHLRLALRAYIAYFNGERPHQGIAQQVPLRADVPPAPAKQPGGVEAIAILGGLHHAYRRVA